MSWMFYPSMIAIQAAIIYVRWQYPTPTGNLVIVCSGLTIFMIALKWIDAIWKSRKEKT